MWNKCGFFLRFYMLEGEIHAFVRGRCVSSCYGECLPPSCTLGLVTIIDIYYTYFLYMLMYVSFTYPYMCCFVFFFFLSLCTYFLYLYAIYYFCFTQRCLDEFCLKCFRNIGCQSLLAINSLLAKIFKSLC